MSDERLKEMATFFHNHNLLDQAAARLFLDMYDEEPPAVADLAANSVTMADIRSMDADMSCVPSFFGGPEKIRPRHCPDIARSRYSAYPN